MKKNKLISIIMPTFNSEATIKNSILSVINQSYQSWELIITDDCSTDNTTSIISKFLQSENRIFLYKFKKNKGAAEARNFSIKKSKGEYLAFLDSDDIWDKTKLHVQINFMLSNKYSFTYTSYYTKKNKEIINKKINVRRKVSLNDILKSCDIYTSTVILKKKIMSQEMPNLRRRQDFLTWANILSKIKYAYAVNLPLTGYNLTSNSLSSNKLYAAKIQWVCYRKHLKLGFFKSLYYFFNYAFFGVIKRIKQI